VEVLRVHDVAAMVDAVKVADHLRAMARQTQPNSQDS